MKHVTLISLVVLCTTVGMSALPGKAETLGQPRQQVAAAAQLGGGFIELLMTGRDPTPPRREAMRGADPFADQAGRGSSLSGTSDGLSMQRALPERFRRQTVEYLGPEKPGTIVIDTANKYLYLVEAGGQAIRYGIGVGREGFIWHGAHAITMKREWPDWRPPDEMRKRRPDLPAWMPGGPDNPLGARALYLGSTLYRIHGTNEPSTIGQNVSSGCIRLTNEDVLDLYQRVRVGTRVVAS